MWGAQLVLFLIGEKLRQLHFFPVLLSALCASVVNNPGGTRGADHLFMSGFGWSGLEPGSDQYFSIRRMTWSVEPVRFFAS